MTALDGCQSRGVTEPQRDGGSRKVDGEGAHDGFSSLRVVRLLTDVGVAGIVRVLGPSSRACSAGALSLPVTAYRFVCARTGFGGDCLFSLVQTNFLFILLFLFTVLFCPFAFPLPDAP